MNIQAQTTVNFVHKDWLKLQPDNQNLYLNAQNPFYKKAGTLIPSVIKTEGMDKCRYLCRKESSKEKLWNGLRIVLEVSQTWHTH